ncbi:hypothetical protein KQ51_00946 [Candidatus Izimaplasma bacterium HR1]|jgi:hypothetical protein|uniref:hypothetical protein n=1 Tax=Candidatus Izimoplasma sp. HR1 TaxID=1541959 RepID=UPI0004F5EEF2|nr:hypothetical protein KQ51_00946 [Candidatus Izimaplasma bacterium HR1]
MSLPQIIFVASGILVIIVGLSRFGFNGRKAQRWIKLIGVVPTQILYVVIGIALIVIAFTVNLGTI